MSPAALTRTLRFFSREHLRQSLRVSNGRLGLQTAVQEPFAAGSLLQLTIRVDGLAAPLALHGYPSVRRASSTGLGATDAYQFFLPVERHEGALRFLYEFSAGRRADSGRREPRWPCQYATMLSIGARTRLMLPAQVLDVSAAGAQLALVSEAHVKTVGGPGAALRFDLLDEGAVRVGNVAARVRWALAARVGVELTEENGAPTMAAWRALLGTLAG